MIDYRARQDHRMIGVTGRVPNLLVIVLVDDGLRSHSCDTNSWK